MNAYSKLRLCLFATGCALALAAEGTSLSKANATESAGAASHCANGVLDVGETCTDCPADCIVASCATAPPQRKVSLQFTAPPEQDISGLKVLLSYRSSLVTLPGSGAAASVKERFTGAPDKAVVAVNDLDYAARVVIGRSKAIVSGPLLSVTFDSCSGAIAPKASDFACTIEGCANAFGPVDGCLCVVAVE